MRPARRPDDGDRPVRVVHAVGADRAEQGVGEPGVPAAAHDQQVRPFGRPDQDIRRVALDHRACTQSGHSAPNTSFSASLRVFSAIEPKSALSAPTGAQPKNAGYCQAVTASSVAPSYRACRAAHRSACAAPADPSTPTTTRGRCPLPVSVMMLLSSALRTIVPALPSSRAWASSRQPMAAMPPVAATNRQAASTLGPIEPAGNAPARSRPRSWAGVARRIGRASRVP